MLALSARVISVFAVKGVCEEGIYVMRRRVPRLRRPIGIGKQGVLMESFLESMLLSRTRGTISSTSGMSAQHPALLAGMTRSIERSSDSGLEIFNLRPSPSCTDRLES